MLALPRTAEYALRAVSYIAEHQNKGPVPVSEIAKALSAPQNYLSKTLYRLGALGVLESVRGVQGGYRLGMVPQQCRLSTIVEPFLAESEHHCIMGRVRCSEEVPCGAHRRWMAVLDTARSFFSELTMADLLTPPVTGATTVNDLLLRYARSAPVLSGLGIDTCCGGGQSLEEAARGAGLTLAELLARLKPALEAA
jgi:Rrf2 family nitric oxide-sensitive transcriptional repressor